MGDARIQGIACLWRDLSNGSGGHVMVTFRGFSESSPRYIRQGGLGSFPYPHLHHVLV